MATFGKGLRGKQLEEQEKAASGEGKSSSKEAPKPEKKPRTMTQAEFSGYKKGGTLRSTGPDSARDSKGWEYKNDGSMSEDSAGIRREQANEIERETKRTISRTKALDASTKMGNPATYKKGGVVGKRGWGIARCKG